MDAATLIPTTFKERVQMSSGAFAGDLIDIEAHEEGGLPITTLYFSDVKWAFGGETSIVQIQYKGGRVGDITLRATGMPEFEAGWRYVILLDAIGDVYVPFTAGEYGAYQVISSLHGDELLVNAAGEVLLVSGTGRLRPARRFEENASGNEIASIAPDFHRPLGEVSCIELMRRWALHESHSESPDRDQSTLILGAQ